MGKRAANVVRATPSPADLRTATVSFVGADRLEIDVDGVARSAVLSPQLFGVVEGQRVLAVDADAQGDWLIVAAWPVHGRSAATPLDFDAETGALRIRAPHIDLAAVASIELSCGATRIRLSVDGRVRIDGQDIVSSAIGAHRIEGGTIDLN